jgi:hypothetical protein
MRWPRDAACVSKVRRVDVKEDEIDPAFRIEEPQRLQ